MAGLDACEEQGLVYWSIFCKMFERACRPEYLPGVCRFATEPRVVWSLDLAPCYILLRLQQI